MIETKSMQSPNAHERCFFLKVREKQIFCTEYIPFQREQNHDGILLCKPMWGERTRTRRIFTNMGRYLRDNGFYTLTFDFSGDGNSGGDVDMMSFFSMVDDLLNVHNYALESFALTSFFLVGMRIGANCIAEALPKIKLAKRAVLLEPLQNPLESLKDALRANLTNQMAVYKKIVKTRETLINEIKTGITVPVDGFIITKELWDSFEQISPLRIQANSLETITILSVLQKGKKRSDYSSNIRTGGNILFDSVESDFSWTDWKYYDPNPSRLYRKVCDGLGISLS